jgi:cellobiose transport system substrate-binding protein
MGHRDDPGRQRQLGRLVPELYSDPAVATFRNQFFSNAPVGQIFTTAARKLQPQHHGPKTGDITLAFLNAIGRVEQGRQDAAASWSQLLDDVARLGE